jgi:hypothetical protein
MSAQHHDDVVTIVVVRTGGFAGLHRQWQVEAADGDVERWLVLVDACPWDHASDDASGQDDAAPEHPAANDQPTADPRVESTPGPAKTPEPEPTPGPEQTPAPEPPPEDEPVRSASRGADRFVWSIRARTPVQHLEQHLPEPELVGPWRRLVDAVRSAG